MKITGTKSYVLVELEGKRLKIDGELTLAPIFYAYKNSIKYWEFENKKISINEEEKKKLIDLIVSESSKEDNIKIVFE